MEKIQLLVILGATATGKTQLSIELAKELSGEIVSADSMQIYKGMDIGTAKPNQDLKKEIPHHLLSIISPFEEYSVADFQRDATTFIKEIHERGKRPILVGGSGLYVKALLEGFIFPPLKKDQAFRQSCQDIIDTFGIPYLHQRLQLIDEESAEKIHPHDLRRVIRALEIYQQTKKTPTYFRKKAKERPSHYRTLKIGLTASREVLYQRIEDRVDRMIEGGLVNEVKDLLEKGCTRDLVAMQSLGYREILSYLEGKYSLQEAIHLIKRNTRHFAKRQLTWFRGEEGVHWFKINEQNMKVIFQESLSLAECFLSH